MLKEETAKAPDAKSKFEIFVLEKLSFFERNQDFFRIFISETSKFRWAIDRKIEASALMSEHMNYLADIILKAQREKLIRRDFKAEHIADIFAAILSTTIVGLLKEKPDHFGELKNISGFIFDLFMNGVRA